MLLRDTATRSGLAMHAQCLRAGCAAAVGRNSRAGSIRRTVCALPGSRVPARSRRAHTGGMSCVPGPLGAEFALVKQNTVNRRTPPVGDRTSVEAPGEPRQTRLGLPAAALAAALLSLAHPGARIPCPSPGSLGGVEAARQNCCRHSQQPPRPPRIRSPISQWRSAGARPPSPRRAALTCRLPLAPCRRRLRRRRILRGWGG